MKKRNLKKMLREKQDDYNVLMDAYIAARAEIVALNRQLITDDMVNDVAPILEPFIAKPRVFYVSVYGTGDVGPLRSSPEKCNQKSYDGVEVIKLVEEIPSNLVPD